MTALCQKRTRCDAAKRAVFCRPFYYGSYQGFSRLDLSAARKAIASARAGKDHA